VEIGEALLKRKSCRKFDPYKIPERFLDDFFNAILEAPHASGGPRCTTAIYTKQKYLDELQIACCNQSQVGECSVAYIFSGMDVERNLRSGHPKYIFDCVLAASYLDLKATELGFGTCWIGNFHRDKVLKMVPVKKAIPVIILVIGVPGVTT